MSIGLATLCHTVSAQRLIRPNPRRGVAVSNQRDRTPQMTGV